MDGPVRLAIRLGTIAGALCFLLLLAAAGQSLTLPVKEGSVRFAAIGDMGTGDPAQYQIAQRMLEYRQNFPFDFSINAGRQHLRREESGRFAE